MILLEEVEIAKKLIEDYNKQEKTEPNPTIKKISVIKIIKIVHFDGTIETKQEFHNLQLCEIIGLFEVLKHDLIVNTKR